ncbi:MAG: hypothetical protein AAB425_01365 [Bdellovibrionota bacterium]
MSPEEKAGIEVSGKTPKEQALANLAAAIDASKEFPQNIFSHSWHGFLFFDPDRIFNPKFERQVRALLEIEGSSCACLVNLDRPLVGDSQDAGVFCFEKEAAEGDYKQALAGPTPGAGLGDGLERFGCASNGGQWVIYCEQQDELAVIAFRNHAFMNKFNSVMVELGALPIQEVLQKPGWSSNPAWHKELVGEYVNRSQIGVDVTPRN